LYGIGVPKGVQHIKNCLNRSRQTEIISEIQLKFQSYQKVAIHSYIYIYRFSFRLFDLSIDFVQQYLKQYELSYHRLKVNNKKLIEI
jgi:hypothetical protein